MLAVLLEQRRDQVAVQLADAGQRNALRADLGALADVGATAEALVVVLGDHGLDAAVPLGLALRQHRQVRDLRGREQHGGAVRARRDAGAATDAGGVVEGDVGLALGGGGRVGLGRRARVRRDEAAGLDDPVEGRAVYHQVLNDRESTRPPRLHVDGGAVGERTHVQLAGGGRRYADGGDDHHRVLPDHRLCADLWQKSADAQRL